MKIIELCAIDQTLKIFLDSLNKALINKGYDVICVCSKGPYTEELIRAGLNVINISIERKIKLCSNIKSIYRLYKLFKSEKPDVLHVHTPIASVLGRIAAKFAKVPIVIYTAHGFYFHDNMAPIKYKLFLSIEKYMAKYFTDFIFTQSEEDRLTAIKNDFIDGTKVECIGNGIDVFGKFNPENVNHVEIKKLYEELNLSEENIIITFIGRLVEEKGIMELLEAFCNISDENIKLLVVGDIDQGCRDEKTKNLIAGKYKDNQNIIFTGFREDIENILYITDIFCLPSYREGMPRTIIEAMSMECAVVATDIRGCREEITDGETGFLVKLRSVYDIQNKLEILIQNKELLNNMKIEGRKKAEKHYDENQIVDKQINIINRLYEGYMSIGEAIFQKGIFVLSLDVELCWGTVDKPDELEKNKRYYEQARDCIEKILMLLEKYNISATWAVVGHLFLEECDPINGQKHSNIPRSIYPWYSKDWFEESPCTNHKKDPLWYGPDIVQSIINCRVKQEIGCHSFAHIPYGDKNTKRATVRADLANCICEAEKHDLKLRSFVFPRNDVGYIDELNSFGFKAYRGAEPSWYKAFPKKIRKACHMVDQFLAISPPVSIPEYKEEIYNIPASMFYLPMNGFRSLIPLRFRIYKAKKGIRKAIRDKKVFHLWFHPFNIATNQEKLLHGLEEIFKEVESKRENGELETRSMAELVDLSLN